MSTITTLFGALLSLLGAALYARSPSHHATALFPVAIGVPMTAVGLAAADEGPAPAATGVAGGFAAAGLLVSLQGLLRPELFAATAAGSEEHPARRYAQMGTAVLSAAYLGISLAALLGSRRGR
jgi:hypothetical protein